MMKGVSARVCEGTLSPSQAPRKGQGVSKIGVGGPPRHDPGNQEGLSNSEAHPATPAQGPQCTWEQTQAQPCPSHHGTLQAHLGQMLLRSKAKAINSVGATVCPLPELLGGFGKGHVGGDSAVDDGLGGGDTQNSRLMRLIMNVKPPRVLFYISSWEILGVSHCRRETDSGLFPTPIPQAHSKAMTRSRPVPETPGVCHPTQALPGPWHPQC